MKKITKKNTIAEIFNAGGETILKKNGVPCVTCPLAAFEINKLQIEQVVKIYGLDIDKIINDLSKLEQK